MHALGAFVAFICSETPIALIVVSVCECIIILSLFLLFIEEQRKKERPTLPFSKSYDFLSLKKVKRKSVRIRTKKLKVLFYKNFCHAH